MTLDAGFSREELLACVDRELRLRERSYPRWVQLGRMSTKKMLDEIRMMRAVRQAIEGLPATVPDQATLFKEARR